MNRFIIGALIILVIGWLIYSSWYRQNAPAPLVESLPVNTEEESLLEAQVGVEIPEEAEKIKLSSLDEDEEMMGIATRKFEEGEFEHTVIASLPDPQEDEFYEGWLLKDGELFSTGKMEEKKGGWVLEYSASEDKSDYNQVVITLEKVDDDQPEKEVLEGSF